MVALVTVMGVEMSADLQRARVRLSLMGDDEERSATMEILQRARGFLRRRVAEELRHLRSVPQLVLEWDTSIDYSLHIDELLRSIEPPSDTPSRDDS